MVFLLRAHDRLPWLSYPSPHIFVAAHPSSLCTSSSIPWDWFWEYPPMIAELVWSRENPSFILATTKRSFHDCPPWLPLAVRNFHLPLPPPTLLIAKRSFNGCRGPPWGHLDQTWCRYTPPRLPTGRPSPPTALATRPPLPFAVSMLRTHTNSAPPPRYSCK